MKTKTNRAKNRNTPFQQIFASEKAAVSLAAMKTYQHSTGDRAIFVVAPGPADNFAVLDLRSAIELGNGYTWSAL